MGGVPIAAGVDIQLMAPSLIDLGNIIGDFGSADSFPSEWRRQSCSPRRDLRKVSAVSAFEDIPVYLPALLSKGDRKKFSDREIAGFKMLTTKIARSWQERKKR